MLKSMINKAPRLAALALCGLLGACVPAVHQPRPTDPQIDLPEHYAGASKEEPSPALGTWSQFVEDPNLINLIDEALEHNQELEILRQEMGISRSEFMARRGEFLPRLGFFAGAGMERVGLYTSQGASDAAHEIEPGEEVPENLGDLHLGFQASWEIDIWKKLRNGTQAAHYRYLGSIEGRNFMVTLLVEEVADAYFELMALDNQLEVLAANVELFERSLEVVKLQKQAGRVTELAVQRFEAELLKSQSRQYDIRQEIIEAENEINLLCGRYPQRVPRSSGRFAELSPQDIGPGLPTQLIENRPDVREAELELEAANLDVKVARALFYPSLSIDVEVGYEAYALRKVTVNPKSLFYNVAGNLVAPLLNRKAIKAEYFAANARQMQALVTYERAVLQAYIEVANQLSKLENLGQSYALKVQQVQILERAKETSSELFRSARADYLEVLTTRREALEAELELIETKQRQLHARINLYQALGGGWREMDSAEE